MPPVLDPINSKVDGLAFLGLSLSRNHYYGRGEGKDGEEGKSASNDEDYNKEGEKLGHPDSYTHQTAFDLNQVIDRDYEFLQATDDNGWYVEKRLTMHWPWIHFNSQIFATRFLFILSFMLHSLHYLHSRNIGSVPFYGSVLYGSVSIYGWFSLVFVHSV